MLISCFYGISLISTIGRSSFHVFNDYVYFFCGVSIHKFCHFLNGNVLSFPQSFNNFLQLLGKAKLKAKCKLGMTMHNINSRQ